MARLIPEETIEEIKARNDIVSVVEQYVQLSKKSQKNYFGLCPFHREDTPSFSVSPSKQIFYCFGCNKGGDVIRFIREIEGLGYPEAIRLLAERAGVRMPDIDEDAWRERSQRRRALEAIAVEAARYFYRGLQGAEGARARDYLARREISVATQRAFGLGFAPDRFDALQRHLEEQGHERALIRESGLVLETRTGKWMDLFRGRLIFPILSGIGKGRVIAFGGRILDGPDSEGQPKYINSPETAIFVKGRQLFGLNLARRSREGKLLLVEGYMDVISLYQAGIDFAVAGLGTALTEEQARLVRQQTEEVVVAYDADAAGQRAALQNMDTLAAAGLRTQVLQIPEGLDPDDYIRQFGAERFRDLIGRSLPLLDYKLQAAAHAAGRDETSTGDILQLQDAVCEVLEGIDNAILLEVYLGKAAALLRTPVDAVRRQLLQRAEQRSRNPARSAPLRTAPASGLGAEAEEEQAILRPLNLSRDEAWLLLLLAQKPGSWAELENAPEARWFGAGVEPETRNWLTAVLALASQEQLTQSRLMQEAEGWQMAGQAWPEVFARMLMQLPDQRDQRRWIEELERRERRVRLAGLQRLLDHYVNLLASGAQTAPVPGAPDEEGERPLRELYYATREDILKLREGADEGVDAED